MIFVDSNILLHAFLVPRRKLTEREEKVEKGVTNTTRSSSILYRVVDQTVERWGGDLNPCCLAATD